MRSPPLLGAEGGAGRGPAPLRCPQAPPPPPLLVSLPGVVEGLQGL